MPYKSHKPIPMQEDEWNSNEWESRHSMVTMENINTVLSANSHWDDLGWMWSPSNVHCSSEIFSFQRYIELYSLCLYCKS